ncbi:hypothetical protein RCF27_10230 [Rhodococcus pyridinivorans]|uniref:Uncharacterized protein n=1 Tax=Rhodococcus pyridinivorans TaxID=103816 RepID=A0A7M2XSJ9_9NOCA|nr:hypothetical protein [Rhodococcus pyridinivorans]QOW00618.1 hypothetical protein INP59_10035 [Rhodococcus pyridinivorans]WMM74622.1 hypothetical protein RCF27_10230 [Rhodococcus pyridinivorans]
MTQSKNNPHPAAGTLDRLLARGSRNPHQLGVVGTDEHPITVVNLPRERQLYLACRCGWTAVAVTLNHAQLLTGQHAPDQHSD